jgi:two-component system sensor kinase FixL
VQKHLRIVEREIATADRIVTGLLDFARVTPSNRAPMDVNAMIEGYLERWPLPPGVVPALTLSATLPPVVADPGQIELIFGNLVRNAVQAMPDGGTLTVQAVAREGAVRVIVGDTGVGIRAEDLDRIFEPLFTTKATGMGLGLSVARRLAAANGASLTATSVPGQGSRFDLVFSSTEAGSREP